MSRNSLSIIIPCFNEERAIDHVLKRYESVRAELMTTYFSGGVELIVVNDGSTDGTLSALEKFRHITTIVNLPIRQGYGGAIKVGMRLAKAEWMAFYDMDATYDPLDIKYLMDHMELNRVTLASGDRLSQIEKMPFIRKIGNQMFVSMLRLLFWRNVYDCCSGLRVFHSRHKDVFIEHLPQRLNFTLAMTILFLVLKEPFVEVPISYNRRLGKSKLKVLLDGPLFLFSIFYHFFRFHYVKSTITFRT